MANLESEQIDQGSNMAAVPVIGIGRKVAQAVIDGYNSWCIDSIMSFRATTCVHQVVPSSLSRPLMNNEAYRTYLTSLLPLFRNFHVTAHDVIEDAAASKVVIWASSTAETEIGPYANEYVLLLYFDSEGKVEKLFEFVDSARSAAFFGRLMEFRGSNNSAREEL